jgi:hypothetical protein
MTEQNDGAAKVGAAGLLALALARLANAEKTLETLRQVERVTREAQARERDKVRRLAWDLGPVLADLEAKTRAAREAGAHGAAETLAALAYGFKRTAREAQKLAGFWGS